MFMLVVLNLPCLLITIAGAILGFFAQLFINPEPLRDQYATEHDDWFLLVLGLFAIGADVFLRRRDGPLHQVRWWLVNPDVGGHLFYIACWIWGCVLAGFGIAGALGWR